MDVSTETAWVSLLRGGEVEAFNRQAEHEPPNLENADLRMVDARGFNLRRANLRGAYLRDADLRSVDLSEAEMDGASIHEARISGAFFPDELDAQEITLSVWKGTRMRTRRG